VPGSKYFVAEVLTDMLKPWQATRSLRAFPLCKKFFRALTMKQHFTSRLRHLQTFQSLKTH
jgi:hypothetical protein